MRKALALTKIEPLASGKKSVTLLTDTLADILLFTLRKSDVLHTDIKHTHTDRDLLFSQEERQIEENIFQFASRGAFSFIFVYDVVNIF
jgi:hypothetical protein